ncbi:MAG: PEP/pyruvate-binding domain-containing protein [Anaerolineae bacterium]|jgi:pyruvate,water dikinase|nr:PEP/pyruvate-binding domain-containing protein [Anaerolineae bacterium]
MNAMQIVWLEQPDCRNPFLVGGKAAGLGKLAAQHPVPPGFCLAASNRGKDAKTKPVRDFTRQLTAAYARLGERCGSDRPRVAVRSSAVDEDGQEASFAGQHETYLNVMGADAVAEAVERCLDSAHSTRALTYRRAHGLAGAGGTGIAVLVQQLILADVSTVVFSADPRTGDRDHVLINATWGLGESLVGGSVIPDLYIVRKANLEIVGRQVADKAVMTIAQPEGTREVPTPRFMRTQPALQDEQIVALARLARTLETTEKQPVDLECAYQQGRLYLLQCRPITTVR